MGAPGEQLRVAGVEWLPRGLDHHLHGRLFDHVRPHQLAAGSFGD
jgi:hypothetical protein